MDCLALDKQLVSSCLNLILNSLISPHLVSTGTMTTLTPPTPAPNPAPKNKKATKKKAIPWDRDSLTYNPNYQRWRGGLEEGKTKKSLCSKIIEVIDIFLQDGSLVEFMKASYKVTNWAM
ncbi:uncharacterized protein VP01_243g6 [Puccinia sorghi]|uniref:Uncharacterized protein n=1 Tax=Puccinia sorghi TaxID=27349 RepID=A0A0L6V677_9BASI|nr:uncharacterized protein VP01_243g6 [Puccinia sorghi]